MLVGGGATLLKMLFKFEWCSCWNASSMGVLLFSLLIDVARTGSHWKPLSQKHLGLACWDVGTIVWYWT
jgi:hypothetical protein